MERIFFEKFLKGLAKTLCVILVLLLLYAYRDVYMNFFDKVVHDAFLNKVIIPKRTFNKRDYDFETVKQTTNFTPNNIEDIKNIFYSVLNNGWDKFTFYCPFEYKSCIEDTMNVANKSEFIDLLNFYVSPYNNYSKYNVSVSMKGEIFLEIKKVYSDDEIIYLNKYIDDTLIKLGVDENNPTEKDLKKIHDHIISKVTYDTKYDKNNLQSKSNSAIGAAHDGIAICSGYTDLYALFLDKLNIKNIKIPSSEHIWNYIYFNNKWYHIDLTWDDDEVNKNNTHNFFMISSKELLKLDSEKHTLNENVYLELKQ